MESGVNFFVLFSFGMASIYLFMMISWFIVWKLYSSNSSHQYPAPSTKVTIILPVRNEQDNIINCLKCLTAQNYPEGLLEIIVSDDFSSDNTTTICKNFIASGNSSKHKINLITASEDFGRGKKAAIEHAIHMAKGELIITTDADCIMDVNWVNSYVNIFEEKNPQMITGFVKIAPVNSFFTAIQSLEFLSLSGSAAISVIRQKPLMCNGANLAFSKSAFTSAGGYRYGTNDPSGDDTYLMLKIASKNPASLLFNNSTDSIVATTGITGLKALISQRIRWASKIKNYKESYIKRSGLFIFTINLTLIILLILSLFNFASWQITILIWLMKLIADLFILYPACTFSSQRYLLLLILPAGVLYPFYSIAGMLLASGKVNYDWKDRKY